ncbi:class F sortase [Microcella daejeonensis]|uniref:Class F sortase n=1 Tax=Microcella daejeonensis TaxID=2994971 RepID=A0A9E8MLA7_9MICO|nr:class F sortase [Microcella daejeonensis]WAB81569.1 class F sortase [Microcella daejeonensis]WAB83716.1 class F sortase [Microcella daejeonensis]
MTRRRIPAQLALATAGVLLLASCSAPPAPPAAAPSTPPPAAPAEPFPIEAQTGPGDPAQQQTVATVAPGRLSVPSLGIEVPVSPEGVEPDGYMSIPEDIDVAGWYEFGAGPASESGSTVIAAHVDDPVQGIGPFARLREAQVGAEATVVDAAGTTHVYRVTSVERIVKSEVPLDRVFTQAGAPHLVLITCGGAFDRAARSYTDNYIVTAEKIA